MLNLRAPTKLFTKVETEDKAQNMKYFDVHFPNKSDHTSNFEVPEQQTPSWTFFVINDFIIKYIK